MIVAHLLGATEVNGIPIGTVFINDVQLPTRYEEIVSVVGNISLLVDTDEVSYRKAVQEVTLWDTVTAQKFIDDNYLLEYVDYAKVRVTDNQVTYYIAV